MNDIDEDSLDGSILEFWSYILLGLKETASLRFGDPVIKIQEYSYEDALYCYGIYEDFKQIGD